MYEPDVTAGNALTVSTAYAYTALDRIDHVTQNSTTTHSFTYDSLGRLKTATDPETGLMQYSYNSFDQLTQRTDALTVITGYSYDTLNRPYQVTYNVGATGVPATPTVTYTYGTTPASFNNGRLLTLDTAGIETDTYSYNNLGQVTNLSKNITGAKTYSIGYSYNLAGELKTLTYPSGRVVTQTYDTIGRLSQLSDGTRTYANAFAFNPAGEVLGYTAGNTIQGVFGYSDSRLELQTLTYKKGLTTLFSLGYGYTQPNGGNNGQITAITDNITAANSLTYTYDALGRLTRGKTANTTSPNTWDISWTYDVYGNRKNQTETAGTLAVTNSNFTFDSHNCLLGGFACGASGNMTNDGLTTNYVYDAENRYVKLGTTTINTYDGNSLRIKKVTGAATVVYVYARGKLIAEYDPTAATTAPTKEYIYLGSHLLAALDASHNPTYHHPDHLSVRMYSDNSGTVIGTQGHLPFGEAWYATGSVDKWKFTSYERDTDTGLDYAMMRFSSPRLSRFMTPDPYRGSTNIGGPQSWNRYPYVQNDPVGHIDPSGSQCYTYPNGVTVDDGTKPPCDHTTPLYEEDTVCGDCDEADQAMPDPHRLMVDWFHFPHPIFPGLIVLPSKPPSVPEVVTPVVKSPPQPKPPSGKYSDYVLCTIAEEIDTAFGDDDLAFTTFVINIAPYAPANLLKADPLYYLGLAAVYDFRIALQAHQDCTKQVYGTD